VNVRHMFFAAQTVAPQMKRLGGGAIINLGSIIGGLSNRASRYTTWPKLPSPVDPACWRENLPLGIRVNTLSPGAVWTERQIKLWDTPEFEMELMAGQCLKTACTSQRHCVHGAVLASGAAEKMYAQDSS